MTRIIKIGGNEMNKPGFLDDLARQIAVLVDAAAFDGNRDQRFGDGAIKSGTAREEIDLRILRGIVELHDHREAAAQRGVERIDGVVFAEVGSGHDQQVVTRAGEHPAVILRHPRHVERAIAVHVKQLVPAQVAGLAVEKTDQQVDLFTGK